MVADDARKKRLALAAVLLALLAWSGAIVQGGFSFDDREAIFENPAVSGDLSIAEVFRRDYWHHRGDAGQYRPVATLSLRLDHALYGERARGYHLTNVVLQALVVGVLAWTLLGTAGAGAFAFLGLVVFAAHPALADSVAWISGRTSMLGALGGALALLSIVRVERLPLATIGVTLGLLFGLLAKEDAVVFALPLLLLARARSKGAMVACGFSLLSAVAVYVVLRAGALGSPLPSAPYAPLADAPFFERLVYAGRSLLEGLRVFLVPVGHTPNYRHAPGFHVGEAPGAWALMGWIPWAVLLVGGAWRFRRAGRAGDARGRLVGASMALSALSLLPVLQLVPAGVVFAPRFLYLPILFGAPALGAVLRRLPDVAIGVLLALLLVGAVVRSGVYADRLAYNRAILDHVERDVAAWNALGLAYEENGDLEGARQAWRTAIRVNPRHSRTWSNLGRLAMDLNDLDAAERYSRQAVKTGPRNPVARVNFGSLLLRRDRPEEAEDQYAQAARLAPGMMEAWLGLGSARLRQGKRKGAKAALERALEVAPGDERTLKLLERLR